MVLLPAPAVASSSSAARTAPQFNSTVWAVAFRGNVVYAGGSFTSVTSHGRTYERRKLAAFDARTGAILPWNPSANGTVRALVVTTAGRPAVYAAGDFDEVGGRRRDAVARIDAATGRPAAFAHRISGTAATLTAGHGRIYVGGSFSAVDGTTRRNLAAFRHATGALDRGFRAGTDSRIRTLAATRTRLYLGGDFHKVNGSRRGNLAAVSPDTGRLIAAFRPRAPHNVLDLAVSRSGLSTGTAGPGGRAVGYSPSGKVRWTHLFDGDVHNVAVLGTTTYAGGHFDRACRSTSTIAQLGCPAGYSPRVKLAALDGSGRLTSWNPRLNGRAGVHALTADASQRRVAAGGAFTAVGGANRQRFALFRG